MCKYNIQFLVCFLIPLDTELKFITEQWSGAMDDMTS